MLTPFELKDSDLLLLPALMSTEIVMRIQGCSRGEFAPTLMTCCADLVKRDGFKGIQEEKIYGIGVVGYQVMMTIQVALAYHTYSLSARISLPVTLLASNGVMHSHSGISPSLQ